MARVICARPNARLWECSIDGNVLQTHKFKSVVEAKNGIITQTHYQLDEVSICSTLVEHEISEILTNLQIINKELVLGQTKKAFYIFDLLNSKIVLWSHFITPIHTIQVISDTISIFTEDLRSYSFQLVPKKNLNYPTIIYDIDQSVKSGESNDQSEYETCKIETNILQHLFFIYKSFKMSKFNMNERYFEFLDKYDVHDIKRLLHKLEQIIESDCGVTQLEAKRSCASIYLNYIEISIQNILKKIESGQGNTFDPGSNSNKALYTINEYVIECFSLINTPANESNLQRCNLCNFPLNVDETHLEFKEIARVIIGKFLNSIDLERLFDIIDLIPTLLFILLDILTDEHFEQKTKSVKHKMNIVDIYFACFPTSLRDPISSCIQTIEFWTEFFSRLIRLHNKNIIQCIRCKTNSAYNSEIILRFSYELAFNRCVENVSGISALELCALSAKNIPCDVISKFFFIKCMLKST